MAFSPVAFIAPNYRDYKNYWLKFYEPGTTTPKPIALEADGGTQVAKLQLSADGFIVSAGEAIVMPYIEDYYDAFLFPTEAEADANDTSNAVRVADNINPLNTSLINDLSQAYNFNTKQELIDSVIIFDEGKELTVASIGATYIVTLGVSPYPIGSPDLIGGGYALLKAVNGEVSLRAYGGIFNSAPAASSNVTLSLEFKSFCDASFYYGIVDANEETFYIDSDIYLPKFYKATGHNTASSVRSIDGADVIYQHGDYGIGSGDLFVSHNFIIRGGVNHKLSDVRAALKIKYEGSTGGMFWCIFENMRGIMFFDLSEFGINQNQFINCNPTDATTDYGIEISDNGGIDERECHMNQFIGCDVSRGKGVINSSVKNQMNFIIGGYAEAMTGNYIADGSNFSIINSNADTTGTYTVGLHNSVTGAADIASRTGGDFLPLHHENHISGGCWDNVDSTGKPPSFSGNGAVVTDTTAPFGSGKMFGETTAIDFRAATITIPPILNGGKFNARFSMTAIWRGDLPASITIGGDTYDPAQCCTTLGNSYWLIRLTGVGSDVADTIVTIFRTTTGGISREGYLGNVFVSEGKITPLPKTPALKPELNGYSIEGGVYVESAGAGAGYSASSPIVVPVVFKAPYTIAPLPSVTPKADSSLYAGNFEKVIVTDLTTTGMNINVYFTTDFQGAVFWNVKGV